MDQGRFNRKIGENLRRLRSDARLTQDQLARGVAASRATIASIETGRQAISAYQLMRIARALNLSSLDELFKLRSDQTDADGTTLYRPPEIPERTRSQVTKFISRHGA